MSVAQILFTLKSTGDRGYGHVTSVRVNRDFRGMGLGPLLFKEVSFSKRIELSGLAAVRPLPWPSGRAMAQEGPRVNCTVAPPTCATTVDGLMLTR